MCITPLLHMLVPLTNFFGGHKSTPAPATTVPQRQPSHAPLPNVLAAGTPAGDALRKRMALAGTVYTSPQGALDPANLTGNKLLGS
jgi:hypothetical protein